MNTRKGFTLVELLVVIAILAILATVSVVGYTSFIASAENTAAQSEASSVADAIDVALVMNKKVYIEVQAAVVDDPATTDDETVAGKYILIERTADGRTYEETSDADDLEGYTKIAELPSELADGLSVDDKGKLQYTSDKDVTIEVK